MLFLFSFVGKVKNGSNHWKDVKDKILQIFFPSSCYIQAKSNISMFRQGSDEALYETWERFNVMLIKFSNHGFEDIAQLNIF